MVVAARARLAVVAVDPAVLELAADGRNLGGGALRRADAVVDIEVAAHPKPGTRLQGRCKQTPSSRLTLASASWSTVYIGHYIGERGVWLGDHHVGR